MIIIKKEFPPNINPEIFSTIGAIVGFILEDDLNANELNSIGNWIILVGQFMLTTAAQQQLINYRYQNNLGSRIKSDSKDHTVKNKEKANKSDVDILIKRIKKLEIELNEIKKNSH